MEEVPEENVYAPVMPDETLAPVQEKPGKTLPFEPSAELEPDTLAFDMDQLDKAIEHGKDETEVTRKTEPDLKPAVDSGADSALKTSGERRDAPSSKAPLIEWHEEGQKRTLIFAGPKPDIPNWVKEEGLDLKIAVLFAVTPEGHTTSVSVGESSGYPDVDSAVLEVVRKMRFKPAKVSENVTGTIRYIISTK
jgi:TonB family protein